MLGEVLAFVTLLATAKMSADVVYAQEGEIWLGIAVLLVGSNLAALLYVMY